MVESIDPWVPKLRFWHQIAAFWHQFWHRFFNLFPKWRKCEISKEYNAKRGSEPSKTFDFRIDFSLNFHIFFPNALPETILRGSKCQPILKSAILDRFSIFLGPKTDPWSDMFGQKGSKRSSTPNAGDHPGADLVAI